MHRDHKLKRRDMELWEQLSAENDAFHERMDGYESLPVEERLDKYRNELKDAEAKILDIVDGKYEGHLLKICDCIDDMDRLEWYLGNRYYALSKMFAIHCSDAEVKRIEEQNAHLLDLTNDLFSRTGKMFRYILDMPLEEKDDDIDVEGTLKYWGEEEQDILRLEDDAFYGSDFARMIPIVAFIEREHHGDVPLIQCHPHWDKDEMRNSSMTDKELGVENELDDGTTWAESWLVHPKLDHIVMCYVTHAIITHNDYSVVDYMRMNTFEVKVTVELQQICEQDGSRLWWWDKCSERQFIDKFLHEAEHRPVEMSKGEFIYNRVVEYFDFDGRDECDREAIKRNLEFEQKYPDSTVKDDNSFYKADRMASLPDCRKDDSLIEEFLKKAYTIKP